MFFVKNMFSNVWAFLKFPVYFVLLLIGVMLLIVFVNVVVGLFKGKRFKRGSHKKVKQSNLLVKVFIEAPRAFVNDMFSHDPDFFPYQGLVIYTGRQGQGKTISMVRDIMLMQKEYPKCKCITNLSYVKQDKALSHWRQLITYKNGIYGVIVGLDEIQNWFSSKQSKDFPPEMFEVVTQNRKNRRIIMGTTQNFYQPAKDIRAQCTEVRQCATFFGVFTVVRRMRPVLDSQGDVKEWKNLGSYCFVHTEEIRNSYDTYKVIESLMKSGFQERKSTVGNNTSVVVNVSSGNKK